MKKLLFLGACLVALASQPVRAQTSGDEVVVMSVRAVLIGRTKVILAYGGGKTEEEFVKYMSVSSKAQLETTSDYQRIIAKLYAQGYTLKSTFSQDNSSTSVLIFTKGKEK